MTGLMRWRCRYSKRGKLRFTGHRDVARLWERAFRAAQVPVALSSGFTPRPRISFGLALPTGAESSAEYLDVVLDETRLESPHQLDDRWLIERVSAVLPPGLAFDAAMPVAAGTPSLQEVVVATSWTLTLNPVAEIRDVEVLRSAVDRVMAASQVLVARERKGVTRVDDVRPSIGSLVVQPASDIMSLAATLLTDGRALRPVELVRALVPDGDPLTVTNRVVRTHQWIDDDGAWRELQPAAGVPESTQGGTTWTAPMPPPGHSPTASSQDQHRQLTTI